MKNMLFVRKNHFLSCGKEIVMFVYGHQKTEYESC
jgi:hypothetical protein